MKYCINGRQPYSVLKQCDEVYVQYVDKDRIMDFIEKIPDKRIILDIPGVERDEMDWMLYNEKFESFCLGLHLLSRAEEINELGIKWFWPYPVTTYFELDIIVKLKPFYILLGAPLCFDLERVKKRVGDIELRMIANNAMPRYLAAGALSAVKGPYIRPEDQDAYGKYIDVISFADVETDLKKEQALLHVYKDNKEWPNDLNILIDNLNTSIVNVVLPEEFAENRMNCRQRCMETGICSYCETAAAFTQTIKKIKTNENNLQN